MVHVCYLAWTAVVITVVGMDELLIVRTSVSTPTGPVGRLPFWSPEIWCGQKLDTNWVSQSGGLHVTCSGRSEKGRGRRRQTRTLAHHFHSSHSRSGFTTEGLFLISAQKTGNLMAVSIFSSAFTRQEACVLLPVRQWRQVYIWKLVRCQWTYHWPDV
jgi:hypothetical protein